MVTLHAERLTLRMCRNDNLDGYAELYGDAEVGRYIGGEGRALTRAEAWRNLAMVVGHWHLQDRSGCGPRSTRTQAFVGRIGFFNPEGWPGFELGWAILRRHWGRGFATEGARAALAYAFDNLDRDHVISVIHPDNTRSVRVLCRGAAGRAPGRPDQPEGRRVPRLRHGEASVRASDRRRRAIPPFGVTAAACDEYLRAASRRRE